MVCDDEVLEALDHESLSPDPYQDPPTFVFGFGMAFGSKALGKH